MALWDYDAWARGTIFHDFTFALISCLPGHLLFCLPFLPFPVICVVFFLAIPISLFLFDYHLSYLSFSLQTFLFIF
ncbi:uncharacterized protein B0T15DRAFT_515299 [Chaetomium strumarium]|uniref:Uncharacterized protein n=1 Tax=Chaetomium strumarium TaxID=1170767 RepID=A0AAJ0M529_9PEZI|nr:hypothetical protein B0T15DRAFT_515299 [Chaetomium strumarium]